MTLEKPYEPPIDEAQMAIDTNRKSCYEVVYDYVIKDGETHPIAIICPGGGYEAVCSFIEGVPFARYLNTKGISAVIVYYRIQKEAAYPNPQDDLARAVREVWDRAEELKLDIENYSVWGSSAGGHLAASFGTNHMGYKKYGLPKPCAEILIYPVISMDPETTHLGSKNALIGENATKEQIDFASIDKHVTADYPPTYVWCGDSDQLVPPKNTELMIEALKAAGVPFASDIYPGVDHGVGLATGLSAEGWMDRAIAFWEGQMRGKSYR